MPFNIQFDYRFDTNGWFTSEKRAALAAAVAIWQNIIFDEFPDTPVGTKTPYVRNPQTDEYVNPGSGSIFTTDVPIDDLLIFVGARSFSSAEKLAKIAYAGSSGWYQDQPRYVSGNFEPWIGSATFDINPNYYNWFFDSTPNTSNDIPNSSYDFIEVAVHEIGHILGINSGNVTFKNLMAGNTFVGVSSRLVTHGSGIPLSDDSSHIANGLGSNVMDYSGGSVGTRKLPSSLDIAILEDLGYQTWQTPVDDYLASHPDLIGAFGYNLGAARQHYGSAGFYEGRETDLFLEQRYLDVYPDLKAAFGNDIRAATYHYIQYGYWEGRDALTGFDSSNYIASYGDLITNLGYNPSAGRNHYLKNGYDEGRQTSFKGDAYLASYIDLISVFGYNPNAATQHYITSGYYEGRQTSFKSDIYLASYGDLINAFGYNLAPATQHYITSGVAEGRSSNLFNPIAYLNYYSDLQAAFGNDTGAATKHYIQYGYYEGRTHIS